ncbi:MAG TPA: Ig-like domain-containing protein [Gemmatimonadales bacterium]|nr:Ig-like domain-containing protein [Gemmatimonadales bacterium]
MLAACGGDGGTSPDSSQIVVRPSSLTLAQRQSAQLVPSVLNQAGELVTGAVVTFSSSDTTIVTVDPTGTVTSVGPAGHADVVLRSGKLSKTVPVTVTPTAKGITVSPSPGVIPQKGSLQLTATLVDEVGTPVPNPTLTFSSSNEKVATVSPAGLVTSVGPAGQVTIHVVSGEFSAQTTIAVTQVATSLRVTPSSITLGQGRSLQVTAAVLDAVGDVFPDQLITYSASPASVLSVSPSGVLTPVGPPGTGTLTVKSGMLRLDVPVTVVSTTHPVGTLAGTTSVPSNVWGVAISPTGSKFYAVGLSGTLAAGTLPGFGVTTSPTGRSTATAVVFNNAGTRAYVAGDGGVTVIDAETDAVLGTIAIPDRAIDAVVSEDGSTLYVGGGNPTVYVVDLADGTVTRTLPVSGGGIVHVALHPSKRLLYASTPDGGKVNEIDLQTFGVRSFTVPGRPQALAVSPDGTQVYVANDDFVLNQMNVITLSTGVVSSVSMGCATYGMVQTPDGAQLYLGCGGNVKIVDRATLTLAGTIATGGMPRRFAITPDGSTIVVANESGWIDFIQ